MADSTLSILGVHGLGDHRGSDWERHWEDAFRQSFPALADTKLSFQFVNYDDIFAETDIDWYDCIAAAWKLGTSGLTSIVRRERGVLNDIADKVKWTAGYVVAWVEDDTFQQRSRKRVLDAIRTHRPDIVLAHSLGSLVTYNAFTHPDAADDELAAALARANYVTLGSQIGNPFVIGNLTNGRIQPLKVKFWHHLYNEHDDVFTAPIRVWDMPNFRQTETPFDDPGIGDHAAESYFQNAATIESVWSVIAAETAGARSFAPERPFGAGRKSKARKTRSTRKALLVGINDYPDPANRLEGCVNDVFTISAVLQDCGFPPESIRTCLDERATADGILTRLEWLLDDPQPDDELVFYYSGHGAQIPEYGANFEPDHNVETLVPWDFDWTPEKSIADDQIYALYSQLPYDTRLMIILDCCHSGGMHRNGGPKPRGISPPDDIRHRQIKWDSATQMWVPRDFKPINEDFAPAAEKHVEANYFGSDGATRRLGRAGMLRNVNLREYNRLKKGPETLKGPFLPLIVEACGENELSYEYRHGVTSHGAFTFVLDRILRDEKDISFRELVTKAGSRLSALQYSQTPQVLGPTFLVDAPVPFRINSTGGGPQAS